MWQEQDVSFWLSRICKMVWQIKYLGLAGSYASNISVANFVYGDFTFLGAMESSYVN